MTFIELFLQAIRDELTASIVYIKMAETLSGFDGTEVAKHLVEHADEEYDHYKKLIDFASVHGYADAIDFTNIDNEVIKNAPSGDVMAVIMYTQELEQKAIEDYRALALMADEYDSVEGRCFFGSLLNDEIEHFDDFASWTGQTRECKIPHDKEVSFSEEYDE